MRKKISRMVIPFVTAGTLFILPAAFQTDLSHGKPPPPAQPMMGFAKLHLKKARDFLQKASPNKGGHRAKALHHVNKAMEETQKGIDHWNKQLDKALHK